MTMRDSARVRHLRPTWDLDPAVIDRYQVRISGDPEDREWDAFLAATPGGYHVQTSLWAQVKALLGWRATRVVVTRGEQIVAGAQVLIRPLPFAGAVGYVPRGPLFALDDPVLAELVIDALSQVAKAYRIQCLVVEPPYNGEALTYQLPAWGFRPSPVELMPSATVVLDLTKDLDDILAQMKPKTRYNLRLGQRKGITVREGTESDLSTFYRLLMTTGQRQKFSSYPEEYFSGMWRILHPTGYVRLFIAEYAGEAVSALLATSFGNTVSYKRGGWSGRHGNSHPNEVMHWAAIMWAKSQGYCYYDFEGIDPRAARAVLHNEPLDDSQRQTVTSFKIGFGGQVTLFPGSYGYVYNPLLRWAYTTVFPKVANSPLMAKVQTTLRGIGRG